MKNEVMFGAQNETKNEERSDVWCTERNKKSFIMFLFF